MAAIASISIVFLNVQYSDQWELVIRVSLLGSQTNTRPSSSSTGSRASSNKSTTMSTLNSNSRLSRLVYSQSGIGT